MLKTKNLCYTYNDGTKALKDINIDLKNGNIIGLIGGNGSGKTTLFKNILGLLYPTKGSIYLKNNLIKNKKEDKNELMKKIGVIFQDPEQQIFSSNVYDDIAFGLRNKNLDENKIKKKVERVIKTVKIEKIIDKPVHFLSHGQKKRVAIAGMLALDKQILLLDEPTAGLDPQMTNDLISIIKSLANNGKKIIISSHNMDLVYSITDYCYVLSNGKIIESDLSKKVFKKKELLKKAGLSQPYMLR